jgi:hypothetical protein
MADEPTRPLQITVTPIDDGHCSLTLTYRDTGEVAYEGELDMSEEWALKGLGHILEEGLNGEPVTVDGDWDTWLRDLGKD